MGDGYWANSYWGSGYWASGYWGQGATPLGGDSYHYYYEKKKPNKETELVSLVKQILENM
jgi:hypothetical protein